MQTFLSYNYHLQHATIVYNSLCPIIMCIHVTYYEDALARLPRLLTSTVSNMVMASSFCFGPSGYIKGAYSVKASRCSWFSLSTP